MMSKKFLYASLLLFAFFLPISHDPALLFGLIAILIWIIEGNFKEKWQTIASYKVLWMLPLIGVILIISAVLSDSYSEGFLSLGNRNIFRVIFSHFIAVPFMAIVIATSINPKDINKIVWVFISSVLLSVAISYLVIFQIIDIDTMKSKYSFYKNLSYTNPTPFMNRILYSIFLAVVSILLIDKIVNSNKNGIKLLLLAMLVAVIASLFLNSGRAGQIGFLTAFYIYIFVKFRATLNVIIMSSLVAAAILFISYNYSTAFKNRVQAGASDISLIKNDNYNSSLGSRAGLYLVSFDYLTASVSNFIFGAGAGDSHKEFYDLAREKYSKNNIYSSIKHLPNIHNQYLQFWIDGGIFALIFFILYFYFLYRLPICSTHKPVLHSLATIMLLSCLTNNQIYSYHSAMLFSMITGYFVVLSKSCRLKKWI